MADVKVGDIVRFATDVDKMIVVQVTNANICTLDKDEHVAFYEEFCSLPPVTPIHGTCKDCFYYNIDEDGHGYHCEKYEHTRFPVYANFYCADFKKRGNEDD